MKLWRTRLRRRERRVPAPTTPEVAAPPVDGDGRQERQAVSPEQFDRSPVYVLFRA